jgi:predicted outer membrane protein
MFFSRRAVLVGGLTALPMLGALQALGQETPAPEKEGEAGADLDAVLAAWMMSDGYQQIALSRCAQKHSTTSAVRAFATAEVKEHTGLKKRLEALGFKPTATVGASQSTNAKRAAAAARPDLAALKQELAEQYTATQEAEMGLRRGALFNKSYSCQQLFAHYQMLGEVTVFKRHASGKLRKALAEAQPVIENHIATLKKLLLRLGAAGAVSRLGKR